MGIPLKTRHREVAPNQFEFAPEFGASPVQTDQNLMVMQIIEEVAAKHGMAALLQEKPFKGVNGSGKHNNWSLCTAEGVQLLKPSALNEATGNPDAFPVVMAALVSGIDKHGDLMRMAISSPGNDFRLGACEAPPAVMSTYLGEDMTAYLQKFMDGETAEYKPTTRELSFGVKTIAPIEIPAEDRNRTSPFPYGGARFEFRAAGSSQNVSLINTVLNTLTAEGFKLISERVEAGEKATDVARELLKKHWKVIFNGNGYDPEWPAKASEKGIWRIDSGVDAMCQFSSNKNKQLFADMGIFTAVECEARELVLLEHYTGMVEIECKAMVEMILQHVIPSMKSAGVGDITLLEKEAQLLGKALEEVHAASTPQDAAALARTLRLETMERTRELCDSVEATVPPSLWTLASYRELLFLDSHRV
jgi:glutamine synthetase